MRTEIPLYAVKGAAHYAAQKAKGNRALTRSFDCKKEDIVLLVLDAMDAARREAIFHQYRHAIGRAA